MESENWTQRFKYVVPVALIAVVYQTSTDGREIYHEIDVVLLVVQLNVQRIVVDDSVNLEMKRKRIHLLYFSFVATVPTAGYESESSYFH